MGIRSTDPNPYVAPRMAAASPGFNSSAARLARRVRLSMRLLGASWMVLAIAIYAVVYGIAQLSIEWASEKFGFFTDETGRYHDETLRALLPIHWAPALLFCLGLAAAFRLRAVVWGGVVAAAVAIVALAIAVPHWANGGYGHALGVAGAYAIGLLWIIASGILVLLQIRKLTIAGIPYSWNPNRERWVCRYGDRELDGRVVLVYGRRLSRLGWSWIVLGWLLAVLTFPAFLILPERFHPGVFDWIVMSIAQAATMAIAVAWTVLGRAVLRRSGRAMVMGTCVAYGLVITNAVSLLIPFDFPANYTDMAAITFWSFVTIGVYLVLLSHLVLWTRRKIRRAGLRDDVRVSDSSAVGDEIATR
jgi:hypothetical protein